MFEEMDDEFGISSVVEDEIKKEDYLSKQVHTLLCCSLKLSTNLLRGILARPMNDLLAYFFWACSPSFLFLVSVLFLFAATLRLGAPLCCAASVHGAGPQGAAGRA
jgi:hypothetical protein